MELFSEVIVILGAALGSSLLAFYLRIPNIVGFIVAGALIGPFGLNLIKATEEVHFFAELGVILLLFAIGLEFSPAHLSRLRRIALLGGGLQILLTMGFVGLLAIFFLKTPPNLSLFLGAYIALSSTAIVLTLLQNRGELETPHGRVSLGILLFQDLAIVPLMLLIPFLAGKLRPDEGLFLIGLKSTFLLGGAYVLSRWVLGYFMDFVARTKNRELFLLATLAFCLSVAWAAYLAGLSLSLGAFLAGFVLARSPYSHQAIANILPFKDLLICIFFVSVGMFFDVRFFIENIPLILGAATLVFFVKSGVIFAVLRFVLKYPLHVALLVGVSLFQIGEFSFVLAKEALSYGLITEAQFQFLSSLSVLTMLLTPAALALSRKRLPQKSDEAACPLVPENHLIIVGFGVTGRALRTAARRVGIPYVIIEMNPETVRKEKAKGEPIVFGDATYDYILRQAGLEKARVLAITIPDSKAARVIVGTAKNIRRDVYTLVRTRFVAEMPELLALGADEVVPEELVVALSMFARMLRIYLVPEEQIQHYLEEFTRKHYAFLIRKD